MLFGRPPEAQLTTWLRPSTRRLSAPKPEARPRHVTPTLLTDDAHAGLCQDWAIHARCETARGRATPRPTRPLQELPHRAGCNRPFRDDGTVFIRPRRCVAAVSRKGFANSELDVDALHCERFRQIGSDRECRTGLRKAFKRQACQHLTLIRCQDLPRPRNGIRSLTHAYFLSRWAEDIARGSEDFHFGTRRSGDFGKTIHDLSNWRE